MDWLDVARLIAPLAPAAGSILGGLVPFPGGSLVGQKFGEAIAKQFGVPATPQAVSEAIAAAGEETARAKITAATERARIEIEGFVAIEQAYLHAVEVGLQQSGETMRAELSRQHWFFTGWRPATGWIFALVALAFGLMLVASGAVTVARAPDPIQSLTDAWPLFLGYFSVLGLVVGVYIPARSVEKKAAITAAVPLPKPAPGPRPPGAGPGQHRPPLG